MKRKSRVFLSHVARDRDLARTIAARIAKAGYRVWSSDLEILPGDDWAKKVGEALQNSDAMIVIVSPASAESDWVRREIEFALGSPKYASRVIPVIVHPTTKMPWILDRLNPVRAGGDPDETSRRVVAALDTAVS